MFEVELHVDRRGYTAASAPPTFQKGGQWHIGSDFPMFTEEDILSHNILIQADGDELEYLEYVFGVVSGFRTFKCTGDVAKTIVLNMSGLKWAPLKNAIMTAMDTISERRRWCEVHGFSTQLDER